MIDQLIHDWLRTPVIVAKQHCITAFSFNNGRYVGGAVLLSEDHQIRFPMAEFMARVNAFGSISYGAFRWKDKTSWFAGISRTALSASFRQIASQLLILTFFGIDILIDRLMAKPCLRATRQPDPSRNPLRRPTLLQTLDDRRAQKWITHQLAILTTASRSQAVRRHMPVAFSNRDLLVMPEIASQFPADRRAITSKPARNLGLADLPLIHLRNDAPFIQTQLRKGTGHSILLKLWPLLSSLHLKMECTPLTVKNLISIIMELFT